MVQHEFFTIGHRGAIFSVTEIKRDAAIVAKYSPAKVITWLSPLVAQDRLTLLERVVGARRTDLTVLLDRFWDPHNNAAVLRSAEAFGLREVHIVPGAQGASFSTGVSQGVEKWIDYRVHQGNAYDAIEAEGYTLVGADVQGVQAHELPPGKLCLIMGAEKPGLSDDARARCKHFVTIPMVGMVESFNVSVAAALLIHELCKRPAILVSDKKEVLARYLVQTVQRPEVVLEELSKR
jgi:tRNA (guanosine-2'-O-)-methyltransferase